MSLLSAGHTLSRSASAADRKFGCGRAALSVTRAVGGFKFDVEGQESIEQRCLSIEVPLFEITIDDVVLSVLDESEPLQWAKYLRFHRVRTRVPLAVQYGIDGNRGQTR